MKKFEIRITNTDDDNDLATRYIVASDEADAENILQEIMEAYAK